MNIGIYIQRVKKLFLISKESVISFSKEKSFIHCAALSYYTVLTLVPIIYLGFLSFGKVIGQEKMVLIIGDFLHDHVGIEDVDGILDFLNTINFEQGSLFVEIIGVILLLFSSSALFKALKISINEYMDIEPVFENRKKLILASIQTRLISMLMLAFFGFVIVVIYLLQTILVSFGKQIFDERNSLQWFYSQSAQHGLAILSSILIFWLIFKFLHDGKVPWKTAFAGSVFTSLLLYVGQLLIKYYLGNYFFARQGGISGSLLVILAWMYYSAHIIFLGAKFTSVYGKYTRND
ncbi:MAG: YihY/virulence factor BrkB family protein [Bacteroidetes bacterium]|nr:MAG: YihY/virulence factor BrkB family protein [Bacteroidota bacterium]